MRPVKNVIGVVLGGGRGARLFPLTLIRSKPAVPVGGKYRLIDIPISNCLNSGINKIFVVTQFNSESLNRHVIQTYRFGLFSKGFVDILAAEQTPESAGWFQGTADAVRQSLRHLLAYPAEHFVILSGDQLYRMNFKEILKEHRNRGADATVCVIPVAPEMASSYGILKMAPDGRLTEFFEKPKDPEKIEQLKVAQAAWPDFGVSADKPLMASMGIYIFNRDALIEVLENESQLDFGCDIIPSALETHRVCGHLFKGYWEDIGTIGAFYRANLDLAVEDPQFTFFHPDSPVYTHPRFLPASRIRNCTLEHSVLAEGCSINRALIERSVIGVRSVIRDSHISDTLMMGADYYDHHPGEDLAVGVGQGCEIRGAILDKNARIGNGVKILNDSKLQEFDGENYFIRDGIVIIPKNASIPQGTTI